MREYFTDKDNAQKQREIMREYYADEDNARKQKEKIRGRMQAYNAD